LTHEAKKRTAEDARSAKKKVGRRSAPINADFLEVFFEAHNPLHLRSSALICGYFFSLLSVLNDLLTSQSSHLLDEFRLVGPPRDRYRWID